jgi:hypothetical protein
MDRPIQRGPTPQVSRQRKAEVGQCSSHSIRVGASVILNVARFSEMDIMSRLHWKSDAFKVYLCNSNVLAAKHTQAMSEVDIDQWCIVG